jgi:hypothetical protein
VSSYGGQRLTVEQITQDVESLDHLLKSRPGDQEGKANQTFLFGNAEFVQNKPGPP